MATNFNMRLDPKVRDELNTILAGYGLTIPQAFKLFAHQIVATKTVPLSFDYQKSMPQTDDHGYEDWEKEKIMEAINILQNHPDQMLPMETVHATIMQEARELIKKRKK